MLGWVRTDKCRDVLAKPHLHLAGIRNKHKGASHKAEKLQTAAPREDHNPPPLCLGVVPPGKSLERYNMKAHLVATYTEVTGKTLPYCFH